MAVVDVDEPPGIGEVLDMRATSICGSDLELHQIREPGDPRPRAGVEGVREDGTAVVVEAIGGCMKCEQCLRGAYNLCPTHGQRRAGHQRRWGHGGAVSCTAGQDGLLPAAVDVRRCVHRGAGCRLVARARLAGTGTGTRVAVVGAGVSGSPCRRRGASARRGCSSALEARHPYQKEAGERRSARIDADGVYDVVVEAAGTEASYGQSKVSWLHPA